MFCSFVLYLIVAKMEFFECLFEKMQMIMREMNEKNVTHCVIFQSNGERLDCLISDLFAKIELG